MWFNSVRLHCLFLTRLSRPAVYRPIYQAIRRHGLRRIVEIGVGTAARATRMIEVAAASGGAEQVFYTGIDLFELRAAQDAAGLPLKMAHRTLAATGAKVRLLPGDAHSALSRAVNMLGVADLVVIAADQDRTALAKAWPFIDRLLEDRSQVFLQDPATGVEQGAFQRLPRAEVRQLAAANSQRRRAA